MTARAREAIFAEHGGGGAVRPTPGGPDDPFAADDPLRVFTLWLASADEHEPNDPNAMALATVGADGLPDCRMVLLKGLDAEGSDGDGAAERGFVFFTNRDSAKGRQIEENPQAALLFHWKSLRRQARVRGAVAPVGDAEADAYFASRPLQSRLGAWASPQSRPIASRDALLAAVEAAGERFGDDVPRPPRWGGFRLLPATIEFWLDGEFRLHDRALFRRGEVGWRRERLAP